MLASTTFAPAQRALGRRKQGAALAAGPPRRCGPLLALPSPRSHHAAALPALGGQRQRLGVTARMQRSKTPSRSGRSTVVCVRAGAAGPAPHEAVTLGDLMETLPRRMLPLRVAIAKRLLRPGRALLTPFSNPGANAKLLALCVAQALGSVATLIHDTYLPIFLNDVLKLSNTKMGNLQALSQLMSKAASSMSGPAADLLSPAKMVVFGTLLTFLSKPMFALSGSVHALLGTTACVTWITFAKMFDRASKGVRDAPSKALIGELAALSGDSPAGAFSLRQAMGTLGMLLGAGAASLAFAASRRSYSATFALATLPALLALLLVTTAFGRDRGTVDAVADEEALATVDLEAEDSDAGEVPGEPKLGLRQKAAALLGAFQPAYWQALATVALLYFARFDMQFGTLRAAAVMDKASLPLLVPIVAVPQVLAVPVGLHAKTSVRARNQVLLAGTAVLIAGNLFFSFMPNVAGVVLGALCIGIHMAMTHGVSVGMLSSYIPNTAVRGLGRVAGTAWSVTDFLLGLVLTASNSLAGWLTDLTVRRGLGPIGCFLGGAGACALSMAALAAFSIFGSLGREDLVQRKGPAVAGGAGPAAAGSKAA